MVSTVFYSLMPHIYIYQFKAKNSEIKLYPSCLGNFLKDYTANSMKKTGVNGYVYTFSVDYNIIDTENIFNIQKHLMKKHDLNNVWNY